MPIKLTLLDGVTWCGAPVVGERLHTLLAALALRPADGAADGQLVDALWPDSPPANPTKALQVVVSRARSATSAELIVRTPRGYRLGLNRADIDTSAIADLVHNARAAAARARPNARPTRRSSSPAR